jgi:YidC/Oxa1 family membrane protein insertase
LGNILMFVVILVLALVVYPWVMHKFFPQPKVANPPADQSQIGDKAAKEKKAAADKKPEKENAKPGNQAKVPAKGDKPKAEAAIDDGKATAPPDKNQPNKVLAPPEKKIDEPRQWVTLGSADPDPKNPYRMLVTLSNEGASVARIELSSERYRDLEDRSGYLGHLVMDNTDRKEGCLVQVVGSGTPAAAAGIKPGDRIKKCQSIPIDGPASLEAALRTTKPGRTVELEIQRDKDRLLNLEVKLTRRPLEVIRPERKKPSVAWITDGPFDAISPDNNCPPSLLTTLQQVDGDKLRADEDPDEKMEEELAQQLPGVELRNVNWKIDGQAGDQDQAGGPITKVTFTCLVPKYHLKLTKTYELVKIDGDPAIDVDAKAYHLVLTLQVTNQDSKPHEVAYRLDGPNGLPIEGAWYASKVQKSGVGLRDVVYGLSHSEFEMVACSELSEKSEKGEKFRKNIEGGHFTDEHLPVFFGVDSQYFAAALLPDPNTTAPAIDRAVALRVGEIEEQRKTLTNTSVRLIGKPVTIEAGKSSAPQSYELFAGPKRRTLLAKYEMQGLVYYGWFGWVATPMTQILDFFYLLLRNYGLAVIMLTIVVRLAMFPISRKQAKSAQMMQKIQPEIKEIQKKFAKEPEALRKAQQELFAKHNYNPLGGCLPLFIQMPIFIGLYRALQVNVELRDAPLISHAVRWCSNLAAPDMLFDWSGFMPAAVSSGIGFPWFLFGIGSMAGLGPYLNLFPLVTIALFLIQQKVMMPPAADEQAAQQQKIMKYFMFVMGLMFYKVAAGLCIYFIASTLWGLAERRFLPKTAAAGGSSGDDYEPSRVAPKPDRSTSAEREAIRRKKRGGKK